MLGHEPRLPHTTMRWLIISLLIINGVQLVLLQGVINATLTLDFNSTWTYVALSLVCLLISGGLITYAFMRARSGRAKLTQPGGSSDTK